VLPKIDKLPTISKLPKVSGKKSKVEEIPQFLKDSDRYPSRMRVPNVKASLKTPRVRGGSVSV